MPGPSRRIRVEPVRLPAPSRRPTPAPPKRDPAPAPKPKEPTRQGTPVAVASGKSAGLGSLAIDQKTGPAQFHDPPGRRCSCGIYAMSRPTYPPSSGSWAIAGAIAAWGDIELHAGGFRAQHACVVALTRPSVEEQLALAEAIAAAYDVPLVSSDLLEREALQHGKPFPQELAPEPDETLVGLSPGFRIAPTAFARALLPPPQLLRFGVDLASKPGAPAKKKRRGRRAKKRRSRKQ